MTWSWDSGTPAERADMVRSHALSKKRLSEEYLMKLFCLTEDGLNAILQGDDWREAYEDKAAKA